MNDIETNLSKSLSKVLEIEREDIIKEANEQGIAIVDAGKDDLQLDYEKTRTRLNAMLDKSSSALESAISLAVASESPRSIEALATLIKSISDLNASLLDTHLKMKKIKEDEAKKDETGTTNNTFVFNGTTKELKDFIENMKNKP
jgi:hypothetical protein